MATDDYKKLDGSCKRIMKYIDYQIQLQQDEIDRRMATSRRETEAAAKYVERMVTDGDERIREQIAAQVAHSREMITALRTTLELQVTAQKEAVLKAEVASEDKLESHNGLIEQMREQAVKAEQTLSFIVSTLLPRETFEAYKEAIDHRLALKERDISLMQGTELGVEKIVHRGDVSRTFMVAVAMAVIATTAIIVSIALATHGFTK